ncbi:MAG: hypothetical protein JWM33_1334 [Caulobacteraceae bacterium]|nr:hypothetical protein [Caulobacteraceae bacterium]
MILSRTVGSLLVMQETAATSRILDLPAIRRLHRGQGDYAERPLFADRVLNAALLVRHRMDAADAYLFSERRRWATKVVIPFDPSDLGLGGRYLLVGQRGWREMLRGVCSRPDNLRDDARVLAAIDELPSLDPFLVREHLGRRGFQAADCYFRLAPGDLGPMLNFVVKTIRPLVERAYPGATRQGIGRVAEALLSSDEDDRLAPLCLTLGLGGEAYSQGVFAWRGFLYYKWVQQSLAPDLQRMAHQLPRLRAIGAAEPRLRAYAKSAPRLLLESLQHERAFIDATLVAYDRAFAALLAGSDPSAFRDFLLASSPLFLSLGERLGTLGNLCAFWENRFPPGADLLARVSEIADFAQEFESSMAAARAA